MRGVFKVMLFPVVVILGVMKLVLEGATKLYCLVAGIAINLLLVCSVLAIITQQWFALGVFCMLLIVIFTFLLCVEGTAEFIGCLKNKLQELQ